MDVEISEITDVGVSAITDVGDPDKIDVRVSEITNVEVSETTDVETTNVKVSETIDVEFSAIIIGLDEIMVVGVAKTTVDVIVIDDDKSKVAGISSVCGEKVAVGKIICGVVITLAVVDNGLRAGVCMLTLGIVDVVAMVTTVLVGTKGRSAGE